MKKTRQAPAGFNGEWGGTPIIFLAMFWSGGGPYAIPDIIGAYDWVNRDIPSRDEMVSALNTLLALGLIRKNSDVFSIPKEQWLKFDAFRRKKRKDRFDTARAYFKNLLPIKDVPEVVRLTDQQYQGHYREYLRSLS